MISVGGGQRTAPRHGGSSSRPMVARPVRYGRRNKVKLSYYLSYYLSDMIRQLVQPSKTRTIRARPPCQTPRARSAGGGGYGLRLLSRPRIWSSRGRADVLVGLDGCEVRLFDPCACVRPCVPCVSPARRPPTVGREQVILGLKMVIIQPRSRVEISLDAHPRCALNSCARPPVER